MRTFQQFVEATESDVRAMGGSQAQIDALKARQAKRGYGFESNDKRNASAPSKTQTNRPNTPTVTRPSQPTTTTNKGSVKTATPGTGMPSSRSSSAPKPQSRGGALATTDSSSPATTPKPKSSALATTPKPESSALTTTPKPESSALATTKPDAKPQSRGGAITKSTSQLAKSPKGELAKSPKGEVVPTSNKEPRATRPDETKSAARPGTSKGRYQTPVPAKTYSSLKEPKMKKKKKKDKKKPFPWKSIRKGVVGTAKSIGKQTIQQGGPESKADSVQGSTEIIRGKRS